MLFSFFSPYCWTSRCWLPRGLHVAKTPTCISEVSSYGRHFQIQMSLWSKLMTCGWCGRELEETQVFSESYTLTSDPVTFYKSCTAGVNHHGKPLGIGAATTFSPRWESLVNFPISHALSPPLSLTHPSLSLLSQSSLTITHTEDFFGGGCYVFYVFCNLPFRISWLSEQSGNYLKQLLTILFTILYPSKVLIHVLKTNLKI